jgi:2-polyprenyl-3-methyl-5-hydroxy-6-metoxy-1,4-benzoquinol methylase
MEKPFEQHVCCDLCGADDAEQILRKQERFYVRCRRCGFIYTNPRASEPAADNVKFFEAHKQEYLQAQYSRRKQRAYARRLRRFAPYRKTGRLVEIGSGMGGFLYRAREMGWDPVGVEPVESCARYAREQHGLETVPGTLEEAHLPADAFDVVFSNAVFEHLPSPSRVLAEAFRVLRPGGVIYTKTVNYNSYTREWMGRDWKLLRPIEHVCLFTPQTLRRFHTQAGLEIVKVESSGIRSPRGSGTFVVNAIRKATLSFLSRHTLKGDRLVVLGRKPA